MRLRLGEVPNDLSFRPAADGWRPIREPGPRAIQLAALPVVAVLLLAVAGALSRLAPDVALGGDLVVGLLTIALLVPLHEVVHAVLTPRFGATEHTTVGFWPSRLLFYAYYDAPLPRWRHLLVSLGPLLVLTVLPLALITSGPALGLPAEARSALGFLAFVNAAASSGDVIGAALVVSQVPDRAEVRFSGWRTYWREGVSI